MVQERTVPPVGDEPAGGDGGVPEAGGPVDEGSGGSPRRAALARAVAAVAGGALLYLAFPPLGLWFLAPAGAALVILALYGARPRRAAWLGLLTASAFLLPGLRWVSPIGVDAWLGLVAIESLFYAAWAAATAAVVRLPLWPLWTSALWVAMEWARGEIPFGGFPWVRVAFSQGESVFTPYAALGGAPLVSFAVVFCGALLALAAVRVLRPARAEGAGPAVAEGAGPAVPSPGGAPRRWSRALVLPLAGALAVPLGAFAVPRPGDEGRSVTIGVVQGNVPGRGMYPLGDEPAVVLRNHTGKLHEMARAVREGKLPRPDIVVLPENSTDIDPYRSATARQEIDAAVKDIGVPVLVGAVVAIGDSHRATRSLVWDPVTGPGAYYDKQQLVPFGEYTPLKDLVLALFERANLVGRQSLAGTRDGDLRMGPVTVGAINCYEVAYDDVVRGTARTGASPLVVQTNNATYALTNLPPQQLAMSQLRAVEHNRAVVTSAITGISASVTPEGRVTWQTRELVPDMAVLEVQVRTASTVATRVGALPEWALILMGTFALGAVPARRNRRPARLVDHNDDQQVGDA
ncbi:apolipoprotein N-acyltransferase [Planobispora rosea]|uniref:Apolipoprotein N-acyltransferase n=1 Tax=Planobispora rosea TaxID=35762 RepID=A0A8J3S995_PLARO|nr:apolipoprotein N-acyltransferase [Planobispora rosea]GGT01635.1 apolipoprotein N-acyltransferase [Planobispora rosea]GIH88371.1 apolipoprotein N-acyltransferase [Planobispora rosea]